MQDLRNDQPRGLLVVRRNHRPRRINVTGCSNAAPLGNLIAIPKSAFGHIRGGELPVLGRVVDAIKKALALFVFRQMQEDPDDAGFVGLQVALVIDDRQLPPFPEGVRVNRRLC